jgi:hypothetical protein
MQEEKRSGAAVGFTMFAGVLMVTIGIWHAIAGFAGIIEGEFYTVTPNYILEFDAATWGWIHLVAGVVIALAGVGLFSGALWARTIGVLLAIVSMIANFAFIPVYPLWSIALIALNIGVIWALTVHGRDVVER